MQKQKNKPKHMPNYRNRFLKFALAGFAIFALIIIILIILGPIRFGDGVIQQTSLPDELRPTAEYIQETVSLDARIPLADGVSIQLDTTGFGANTYCFDGGNVPDGYPEHSRIVVNGVLVHGAMNLVLLNNFPEAVILNKCVRGNLESGLHLIEFQLRDSFWGEPIATQQWAIEVD